MPIQHASDAVLARMRRPERQRTIRDNLARFRAAVPELSIRTTCIVGFPGETEDDFARLLDFLEEAQFDRVGAFTYSPQEGTRAYLLEDSVPEGEKRDRLERLTELQRSVTAERYERHLGRPARLLVDHAAARGEPALARAPWQADDIDGVTRVRTAAAAGSFVEATITDVVDDYDFEADLVRVLDAPLAPPVVRRARQLPQLSTVAAATTIGSFGR
jgi:ribosomal protein S12 methylthiotransferase